VAILSDSVVWFRVAANLSGTAEVVVAVAVLLWFWLNGAEERRFLFGMVSPGEKSRQRKK
jgi:hypothetical protein